jgi:hypothetical protein
VFRLWLAMSLHGLVSCLAALFLGQDDQFVFAWRLASVLFDLGGWIYAFRDEPGFLRDPRLILNHVVWIVLILRFFNSECLPAKQLVMLQILREGATPFIAARNMFQMTISSDSFCSYFNSVLLGVSFFLCHNLVNLYTIARVYGSFSFLSHCIGIRQQLVLYSSISILILLSVSWSFSLFRTLHQEFFQPEKED